MTKSILLATRKRCIFFVLASQASQTVYTILHRWINIKSISKWFIGVSFIPSSQSVSLSVVLNDKLRWLRIVSLDGHPLDLLDLFAYRPEHPLSSEKTELHPLWESVRKSKSDTWCSFENIVYKQIYIICKINLSLMASQIKPKGSYFLFTATLYSVH